MGLNNAFQSLWSLDVRLVFIRGYLYHNPKMNDHQVVFQSPKLVFILFYYDFSVYKYN
jgi:hypothetical protein